MTAVTIIGGTGALGKGLAIRLAAAGNAVRICSRSRDRAQDAARDVAAHINGGGCDVSGHENEEAGTLTELVALCVPFASQAENLKLLALAMREGQILIDATVPLAAAVGGRPTQMLGVWQGSAAQQARALLPPEVAVVAALHTVSGKQLGDLDHQLDEDVLICGDKRAHKRKVAELIETVEGLRAVDAGPLDEARIVESLTALLIGINGRHKVHAGIRVTGLPEERERRWPPPPPPKD